MKSTDKTGGMSPHRELNMKVTVLCLFAVLTARAQSTTEHLPVTDAEKIADALRAAPNFITDGATIVGYPASKAANFGFSVEVVMNGLACQVHPPARSMTARDASLEV